MRRRRVAVYPNCASSRASRSVEAQVVLGLSANDVPSAAVLGMSFSGMPMASLPANKTPLATRPRPVDLWRHGVQPGDVVWTKKGWGRCVARRYAVATVELFAGGIEHLFIARMPND